MGDVSDYGTLAADVIISLHEAGEFPVGSQNHKAAQIVEESLMQQLCGDETPNLYYWKKNWLGYVAEEFIDNPEQLAAIQADLRGAGFEVIN